MSTSNFNETHPERGEDELFLTNSDEYPAVRLPGRPSDSTNFSIIPFQTKRKGRVSYNIYGEELCDEWPGSFPVFVSKDEIDKVGGIDVAMRMLPLSNPHVL